MLKNEKKYGLATKAIHAGQEPDKSTGAIMVPIYASSTYVQESPGKHKGYEYSRTQNPTRAAYEKCIADLENGQHGFAFASGMSAADCILSLLEVGSEVIAVDDLYGGTAITDVQRQRAMHRRGRRSPGGWASGPPRRAGMATGPCT